MEFYERGVSATTTSLETGLNIKTVCKYFNQLASDFKKIEDVEFQNRIINERIRYLIVLDRQLLKLYSLQTDMEKNQLIGTTSTGDFFNYHYKERLTLINTIFHIMEKKIELLNEIPGLEESVLQN